MHEMSIAVAMVEQVTEATGDNGSCTVSAVRLQMGELSGVVPDSLQFCFSLACTGTALDGAELLIDHVPGRALCRPCGAQWATGMPPQLCCPQCEGGTADLVSGRELQIVGVRWTGDEPRASARPVSVQANEES